MSADNHVPDIVLERYRLNELPPDDAARLSAQLRQDPSLRQRLAALDQSEQELRGDVWDRLEDGVRRKLTERDAAPRRSAAAWIVPALAAAAIVAIALTRTGSPPAGDSSRSSATDGSDRVKGLKPALALYRRTDRGSETLADGAIARKGHLIREGYRAARRAYCAIVSIDGTGNVTVHLPPAGGRAAPLKREATVLLDQAYELDDAPRWERFYFVAGDAPFDVATVLQAARAAAAAAVGSPPRGLAL